MTPASWTAEPYDSSAAIRLQAELGLGPAAAAILARRGHTDPDEAREFLRAEVRTDAAALPGAIEACALILRHVAAGSRILVFGDYDVDGVSSTAMMIRTLRALGSDPAWQLPSRSEGYGLNVAAVERIAGFATKLLITVDCGVTSVAEVARARELGMDVLVTDHHRPAEQLPDCPIVHPAFGPDGTDGTDGPAGELCAAGVVLKLSEALRAAAGMDPQEAEQDLDLAGLATVCDMVPLRGENRRIAKQGMEALAGTRKPGLRALMRVTGLEPDDVDATSAGFRLGPRINAAGRLQRADAALELLLTEDDGRADQIARELDLLNLDRRETEQRILHEAEAACAPQLASATLVVAGEDWHAGVVGIVASRLVERFRRPAVVIALDGEGGGRGSGRSIAPYDLHAGLSSASGLLRRFGGHRMAAGLELDEVLVPDLRLALAHHAGEALAPADLARVEKIDAVVPGGALTLETAEELERLGPFGAANPAPTLLVPSARIEHVTAMGEERKHARFSLVSGGARARGVAFRRSQRSLAAHGAEPQDVAVSLERNRWNGAVEARVCLKSLNPTRHGRVRDLGESDFWTDVAAELVNDPGQWWAPPAAPPRPTRTLIERHGEGLAGITGELLSSGEDVLLVVADVARRRAGLEHSVAGMATGGLAVASWNALARAPELAEAYPELVAVDPPPVREGLDLLANAPGPGQVHLAWGQPEVDFTLAYWRFNLEIRPEMAALWPALREHGGLDGADLEAALRGAGTHPREGALAGRLLRVMAEIGLIETDVESRETLVSSMEKAELEQSTAFRAYGARLEAAGRHLAAPLTAQLADVG